MKAPLLLAFALTSPILAGTITTYTDQSQWEANAIGLTQENWGNPTDMSWTITDAFGTAGAYSLSSDGNTLNTCLGSSCPGLLDTILTITFDKPIYGFAATWSNSEGAFMVINDTVPIPQDGYFGFLSDTSFSRLDTIYPYSPYGDGSIIDYVSLSNLEVSFDPPGTPTVPEPATYLLVSLALPLLFHRKLVRR